jgi:hypothetical protein
MRVDDRKHAAPFTPTVQDAAGWPYYSRPSTAATGSRLLMSNTAQFSRP